MASVPIENYPKNLTMSDFMSVSDDYGGMVRSCRFASRITPSGNLIKKFGNTFRDLVYLNEAIDLPGRSFVNMDVRYYGPSHKLPFQSNYDDLIMTFICRSDSIEREMFDSWMEIINPTNSFDFNYRDDYRAVVDIFTFAEYNEEDDGEATGPEAKYNFTILNAYPILVNPQAMSWADDNMLRLIVNFTYTHWYRKGIDKTPSTDPITRLTPNQVDGLYLDQ